MSSINQFKYKLQQLVLIILYWQMCNTVCGKSILLNLYQIVKIIPRNYFNRQILKQEFIRVC